jgi:hypothetical protein
MASARELTETEAKQLEAGLSFAAALAEAELPLSLDQVQSLYDAFVEEGVDDAQAVAALGMTFGQCIVASGPFVWVRVIDDEYGDETSVGVLGAAIYLHPISMLQKRLEDREPVVVEQLVNDSLTQLAALVNRGEFQAR